MLQLIIMLSDHTRITYIFINNTLSQCLRNDVYYILFEYHYFVCIHYITCFMISIIVYIHEYIVILNYDMIIYHNE